MTEKKLYIIWWDWDREGYHYKVRKFEDVESPYKEDIDWIFYDNYWVAYGIARLLDGEPAYEPEVKKLRTHPGQFPKIWQLG